VAAFQAKAAQLVGDLLLGQPEPFPYPLER
jgi:hypothetical protein